MRYYGLSFTGAAKRWHLDARTFRQHARSGLRTLQSGRVKALNHDRIRYGFEKPTTKPGQYHPVETRSLAERQLYVQWRVAVEAAGKDDWSQIDAFPKNTFLGGVRLPTGRHEVQRILEALAEEGAPFEGPYRVPAAGAV
jgi:hypothetical protein